VRCASDLPRPWTHLAGFIRVGHDDIQVGRGSAEMHWQPYQRHGGADAFVRQIRSLRTEDTMDVAGRLTSLDTPARVVWGAADRFQKIGYGERFARDLRAPLTRLDGAKHFVPEDHPQAVADAVNEVLDARGSATS
jgi:pimeloyl-ACP methyl ester carboxylesterase